MNGQQRTVMKDEPAFIGVDLAWGEKAGTGLCVIVGDTVLASGRSTTLDDIAAWLEPYTRGTCVVAIDAPLIVRNESGRRTCEQLISRCFGGFHASAHSSNLKLPAFRAGVRAWNLAQHLNLDTDPAFEGATGGRWAIEVYPHTALVSLFDLPVTLKYKAKRGRPVEVRRNEFTRCIDCLESLVAFDPPVRLSTSPSWLALKEEILAAPTGAALDRAEDELDAYICAYTAAYYWTHGTSRCRVVGDTEHGYIVTPVSDDIGALLDAATTELRHQELH